MPIAIHKLMRINTTTKDAILSSEPLGLAQMEQGRHQPVVLIISMLPQEFEMRVCIWKVERGVHCTLLNYLGLFRSHGERDFFSDTLAPHLLAPRGFISDVHNLKLRDRLNSLVLGLMERLRAAGIVEQKGYPWHLIAKGR